LDLPHQRLAAAIQVLLHAPNLGRVFLVGAALEARRQAHLHLGINAAGECWIGTQIEGAAAHLEQVERVVGEFLRGHTRGKRPKVLRADSQAGGSTGLQPGEYFAVQNSGFSPGDARGHGRAWVRIVENELDQRRKAQPYALVVALGELAAQNFVEQERRLEVRASRSPLDPADTIAQVQLAAWPFAGAEQPL